MNAFKLRCFHALVILQVRPLEWTPTYLELDKLPDGRYRATVGTLFEYLSTRDSVESHMTRFLSLVALGLAMAFAPTPGEAASKRIHVIAKVAQQTFTGDLASPKLGDRIIQYVELFDDSEKVGAGAGVCTIVSLQESPPDTPVQCLLSAAAVFDKGQIIFGGLAPFPEAGVVGRFGILGGTDAFRKARGDATLVVLSNGDVDAIFDLE